MLIRPYTPADAAECARLLISNVPKFFVQEDMPALNRWLKALDENTVPYPTAEAIYFYVLEEEKQLLGCAGFYLFKDENRAQLSWGIIDGAQHNKGLGKLLFDYRVHKIKEHWPTRQITLWTSQYTYQYYEKLGMKVSDMEPNGLDNGYDKYIMYLPA